MVNKINTFIILLCFFSCTKNIKKEHTFLPNINISVNELKEYERVKIDVLLYKNRDKDTITSYQFCKYLNTICYQSWEVFFLEKDTLKILSLLEKKSMILFKNGKRLNKVKFGSAFFLKNRNRNILYKGLFQNNNGNCSILLEHEIVLYDKDIDWEANLQPDFYDENLYNSIKQNNN